MLVLPAQDSLLESHCFVSALKRSIEGTTETLNYVFASEGASMLKAINVEIRRGRRMGQISRQSLGSLKPDL